MRKLFNKTVVYLILIVLLAGAVRTARALQEERFSNDVYLYFQMAKDWAHHGAAYTYLYDGNSIPPLLPWVMAMGYNFGSTPEYTGLIIGVLLGSIMPLAAFWIVLNLFGSNKEHDDDMESEKFPRNYAYALLAAFLVAVHPFLARISVSCLREILFLPLMAFAVAFAASAIHNKSLWKWCFFAVLTALANMARREGIFIIAVFFTWLAVEFIAEKKNIKHYALASVIVVVVFSGLSLSVSYMLRDSLCGWSPFFILDIGIFK